MTISPRPASARRTIGPRTARTALVVLLLAASLVAAADEKLPLEQLRLPDGFAIEVFAAAVPDARQMAWSDQGVLFVGSRRAGKVHAAIDRDGDLSADEVVELRDGLFMPSGLALHEGALYVAEVNKIQRFDDAAQRVLAGKGLGEGTVVSEELPSDRHHGWKYLGFAPDGKLVVPVGVNCNICDPEDPYATILRMNPDGSEREIIARGVRNTVGFDFRPGTNELWFTENGRDLMGDDVPNDELNRLTEVGQHFGYPYCHDGKVLDPEFGKGKSCDDYRAPALSLGPHVAGVGMKFYRGEMFPAAYRGRVLMAEHGSWNRTQKIGYRVTMADVDDNGEASGYQDFVAGWLDGQDAWGRPSDVLELPDGSLLIADDQANVIYRVTYEAP